MKTWVIITKFGAHVVKSHYCEEYTAPDGVRRVTCFNGDRSYPDFIPTKVVHEFDYDYVISAAEALSVTEWESRREVKKWL